MRFFYIVSSCLTVLKERAPILAIFAAALRALKLGHLTKFDMYDYKQAVLEQIKIWPIKINLNYRIYDGTIFEGICFFKNRNPSLFIFNDMYYFQGIPQFNELLHYKMLYQLQQQYLQNLLQHFLMNQ